MNEFCKRWFKRGLFLCVLPIFLIVCFGCSVKTYSVLKERPDREMAGNQGYVMGGSSQKKETTQKKRKTYVTEIEFGKQEYEQKEAVSVQQLSEEATADDYYILEEKPIVLDELSSQAQEEASQTMTTYVVKKGDTLEKIAARPDVYNNKNKWHKIYEANKDIIKNPDRIKPGQVLKIPY